MARNQDDIERLFRPMLEIILRDSSNQAEAENGRRQLFALDPDREIVDTLPDMIGRLRKKSINYTPL